MQLAQPKLSAIFEAFRLAKYLNTPTSKGELKQLMERRTVWHGHDENDLRVRIENFLQGDI